MVHPTFTPELTADQLAARATELVPLLRKNAREAEEIRRVPDENVEALVDSGILRMFRPARYGGMECDIRTKVAVFSELARGCASTAWAATMWVDINWLASLFSAEAQDDVFAQNDVRMTATLNPGGTATRTGGGYRVTGTWRFNSGSSHAHWCAQGALIQNDGAAPEPALFLIPYSDLEVQDDWDVMGLRGSASNTVTGTDVFVPAHRVLPLAPLLHGEHIQDVNTSPVYRVHPAHFINTSILPTPVGLAKSARELYMDRLPGSSITYTFYGNKAEAPITHMQVAEATLKTRAAELMAYQVADEIDQQSADGTPFSLEDRARIRGTTGFVTRLCHEAVEVMRFGSGASSIKLDVPIQRVARDMQALSVHAMASPNSTQELYGRVMCGQEPNSYWI